MDDESNVQEEVVADETVDTTEESEVEETETQDDAEESVETEEPVSREQYENLKKALHEERQKGKARQEQPQQAPIPQVDANDLSDVTNEDGTIDPIKYAQKIERNTVQKFRAMSAEERDWEKAIKEYPELETNPDIADAVRGLRDRVLVNRGEWLTYADAAGKILKRVEDATAAGKEAGRKEAQVSETIQKRAGIARPSNRSEETQDSKMSEIKQRMVKGSSKDREAARLEYLQTLE